MYIFLFYYLYLLAPLLTIKFNRYVIYLMSILFIFLICITRDPLVVSDIDTYLLGISSDSDFWLNEISPAFNLLSISFLIF